MPKRLERDRSHLLHMRDAARMTRQIIKERNRDDLDSDRVFQLALVKAVELVGESASRVSVELRTQQTHIPWRKIINMRHILVHNYWRIELDIVWEVAQADMPPLIAQLEAILATEDFQP